MNRRNTVFALVTLGLAPLTVAQQPAKTLRIGVLSLAASNAIPTSEAFRRGLRELGYVEGGNVVIEWRYADNQFEQLPALAMDLVRLRVDVIVTGGTPAIAAAQRATATIPIVMATSGDPVGSGFVKSLARPGTNITGLSIVSTDIAPKLLELLAAMVPKLARVAYLFNPANRISGMVLDKVQQAAPKLGIDILAIEARAAEKIESAFVMMEKQNAGAMIVASDSLFVINRDQVASGAAKHGLPSIAGFPEYVAAGGLMSYGSSRIESWHRAAAYVDKISRGAKPADLPIELPTQFELAINRKSGAALGLTIPKSLLLQAEIID